MTQSELPSIACAGQITEDRIMQNHTRFAARRRARALAVAKTMDMRLILVSGLMLLGLASAWMALRG